MKQKIAIGTGKTKQVVTKIKKYDDFAGGVGDRFWWVPSLENVF